MAENASNDSKGIDAIDTDATLRQLYETGEKVVTSACDAAYKAGSALGEKVGEAERAASSTSTAAKAAVGTIVAGAAVAIVAAASIVASIRK